MQNTVMMLSVHPQHAEKIFLGEKTFEFRRTRPNVPSGAQVLVYVTGPVSALCGMFTAGHIAEDSPPSLWRRFGATSGLTRDALIEYFVGKDVGYAIPVTNPKRLRRDIPLPEMSKRWRGFRPPQSFRYLTESEMNVICSAGKTEQKAKP